MERGYLEDEFAREFWEGEREVRRMPIINRGMFPWVLVTFCVFGCVKV